MISKTRELTNSLDPPHGMELVRKDQQQQQQRRLKTTGYMMIACSNAISKLIKDN